MTTKLAPDATVIAAADEIFDLVRTFDSPKDATSALGLAHAKLLGATFGPERRAEALDYLDGYVKLLKGYVNDGMQ